MAHMDGSHATSTVNAPFWSSWQVKRHLENVYRKLGIHGRGQLIAFVVETLGAAGTTGGDRRTP